MEVKMKRIKNIVAVLAALVLGTSFVFADKAQYDKLLAEAKQYEEKGKLCSALGTYWDAIGSNPGDAKEADESFKRILEGFIKESDLGILRYGNCKPVSSSAYSGNPGPGQYDEFSLYDSWLELCKDFETYWNEHPADILDCKITHEKGDLDIKTRTATYTFTATLSYSEKFNTIAPHIVVAYYKAYRKDWQESELHPAWPAVSAFKDSKTTPVVKFLDAKYSKESARNEGIYRPVSLIHQIDLSQNIAISPDKNSEFFVPAWNNLCAVGGKTGTIENLFIQFSIKDEIGRTIASTGKPIACTVSRVRYVGSVPNVSYEIQASYIASGISASDIKLLDSGKATWSIDKLELTPRTTTCTAKTLSYLFDVTVEFQNVKMLAAGSSIDFLNKGKTGFAQINVFDENKKKLTASAQKTFAQDMLNKNGEKIVLCGAVGTGNSFGNGLGYKHFIAAKILSNGKVFNGDFNNEIEIPLEEFLAQLKNITGYDYKLGYDSNDSRVGVYRDLSDEEITKIKRDILAERDEWKARDWARYSTGNKKQYDIALELYRHIYILKDTGWKTNLYELELKEKKGVYSVAEVPNDSELAKAGLKAKDVITRISVKNYNGSINEVQPSEIKTIQGFSTCTFTIQRGSGKKAQMLEIEVPVIWKGYQPIENIRP